MKYAQVDSKLLKYKRLEMLDYANIITNASTALDWNSIQKGAL